MSFGSVFHCLQELFPQVDVRILKAVAIEHSKDVHAAVESILFEVLPTLSSPHESLLISGDKHRVEQEETFLLRHQEPTDGTNAGLPSGRRSMACEVASETDHTNDTLSVKSTSSDEAVAGSLVSSAHGVNDLEELFVDNDKEEEFPSAEHQEVPSCTANEAAVISDRYSDALHSDIQDLNGDIAYDSLSSIFRENEDHPCLDTSSPKVDKSLTTQQFDLPCHEKKLYSTSDYGLKNFVSEFKESDSIGSLRSSVECMMFDTHMGDAMDKSHPTTITTRSGQIISIDFLEEFISDAKNYKKSLLVAMESVLGMVREVELQEKAAEEAKKRASRVGLDILEEVENLKQMVHQAKETYDMHAGEVYAEKTILATEARELQSRLLNLSNERDKSLSIIDEISRNLEERLAAAEAEKVAAEKEKLEKKESARQALDEQVLIMDKVVQESNKLQKEAEENAKLKEFLMDRGCIVDTLQGEIAVVCEDVKLLKKRIDENLPISKSLSSSQISTSSSMSPERVSPDRVINQAKSYDSLDIPSQEPLSNGDRSSDAKSSQSQKTSPEDEWIFFFKDETELGS